MLTIDLAVQKLAHTSISLQNKHLSFQAICENLRLIKQLAQLEHLGVPLIHVAYLNKLQVKLLPVAIQSCQVIMNGYKPITAYLSHKAAPGDTGKHTLC